MDTGEDAGSTGISEEKGMERPCSSTARSKGQILAGDEDGAIRGIDRVVERNRRGSWVPHAMEAEHPKSIRGVAGWFPYGTM